MCDDQADWAPMLPGRNRRAIQGKNLTPEQIEEISNQYPSYSLEDIEKVDWEPIHITKLKENKRVS